MQLTRRTFFEADIHDQKKEEEERALLQAEERERESRDCSSKEKQLQNKKLTKPASNLKPMPSPRIEHRKGGSQSSLAAGSNAGGLSPGLAHRSIGESTLDIHVDVAQYCIYIAGKFGRKLNLAVWRSMLQPPN